MCDSPADSRVATLAKRDTKREPVYRRSEKVQDKSVSSNAATLDYPVPQCGPEKRRTRPFDGLPSFFEGFCAIGHVTSNMED